MLFQIFSLVFLGLIIDWLFRKIKLPSLTGWLIFGIIISPNTYNLFGSEVLSVSQEFKNLALIVILLRAGLEIDLHSLKKIGIRAILMSFIPCIIEMIFVAFSANKLLDLTLLESFMLGSILSAVSPAIIVPSMIDAIKAKRGIKKGIPTLVLAGSSCDDAVAMVFCASFVSMYIGSNVSLVQNLVDIPISIIVGIIVGIAIAIILNKVFDKFNPRATKRILILLFIATALLKIEEILTIIPFSAIITIMTIGVVILSKNEVYANELSLRYGKLWIFLQILLFTLVGMQIDIKIVLSTGLLGFLIIFIGLLGRSIGVILCLLKSDLNFKERLFVVISYIPKATVQAAIGSMPLNAMLANDLPILPGQIILSIAVLSILITAPLGSFLIYYSRDRLLTRDIK